MNVSSFLNKPIAHRGLHNIHEGIPENSLPAFLAAIAAGYPIELDVHLLADGSVVVFHDDDLARMCGDATRIQNIKSRELQKYRLGNTDEKIPLFAEVLEMVGGRVPVLIEIKQRMKVGRLEQAVADLLDKYNGEFALQSFNPFTLAWFVRNRPGFMRGQLSGDFKGEKMAGVLKWVLSNLYLNWKSKPHFVGYESRALPGKRVGYLRKKGMPVIAWTIRDEAEHLRVKNLCDNIIFESFKP